MIETRRQTPLRRRVLDDGPVLLVTVGVASDRVNDEVAGEALERRRPRHRTRNTLERPAYRVEGVPAAVMGVDSDDVDLGE
jgi:hypothetical protein